MGNVVNNTYSGYEKKLTTQDRIEEMESVLKMLEEQEVEKKDFKNTRNGFKKNLEK